VTNTNRITASIGANVLTAGAASYRGEYYITAGNIKLDAITSITIQQPITPNYSYLTYGTSSTSGSTLIGQMAPLTQTTTFSFTSSTGVSRVGQFASTPAGIYLLYFVVTISCSVSTSTISSINLSAGTGTSSFNPVNYNNIASDFQRCNFTMTSGNLTTRTLFYPLVLLSTTNVNCNFTISFSGGTLNVPVCDNDTCRLIKIA